ncbi:MAG: DUF1648 domain-containing protein [Bacillota bacterium]
MYPYLPAEIPWHFSARGQVDAWAPKWAGIAPAPAVSLVFLAAAKDWSLDVPFRRTVVLAALFAGQLTVIAYSLGCGVWSLVPPVIVLLALVFGWSHEMRMRRSA